MNHRQRQWVMRLAESVLTREEYERCAQVRINDLGFGYDPFGQERESTVLAYILARALYLHWFRVESKGHEHIPLEGRVLLVPNHSGVLPIDAVMIAVDAFMKLQRPRLMRAVVDHFAGILPFMGTWMARAGQVIGARRNFEELLKNEEMVCVFPEGAKGPGKLYSQRYKLLRFNVGFVELALRYRAPIVPVAVVGAEEQAPMLADIKPLAKALGFPYFPITLQFPWLGPLGVIPLPAKYYLTYGEPIRLHDRYPPETVNDPEAVRRIADEVQATVQALVDEGVRSRKTIFGFEELLGRGSGLAGATRPVRRLLLPPASPAKAKVPPPPRRAARTSPPHRTAKEPQS